MRTFSLLLIILVTQQLFSQNGKTALLLDKFSYEGKAENKPHLIALCETEVSGAFIAHGAFSVVDRKYAQKIEQELERQKSENFIDGKVVEQGIAVGAEYIIVGHFNFDKWMLELRLVNISNQEVIEKQEGKVDIYGNTGYYKKQIKKLVDKLAIKLITVENVAVVRVLESKKETAQLILVAGGTKKGFKEGQVLELYQIEVENVEGEDFERFVPIGEAKIEKVENANFSQVKVKKGGETVSKSLSSNKPVYCRKTE
jgi:hypothetical protein